MKASQPFHQGQLDFFCAIYAVINALRLTGELGLADGRNILAESLREVSARPLLWNAVLSNQTDYYWLLRWLFGRFGRKNGFRFRVGHLPPAPLSNKQRRILTNIGKPSGERVAGKVDMSGAKAAGVAGMAEDTFFAPSDAGADASARLPYEFQAHPQYWVSGQFEGKTVADALNNMEEAAPEDSAAHLDSLLGAVELEPRGHAASSGAAPKGAERAGRGLYGLTDEELCAWIGISEPAECSLDSFTSDDLYLPREKSGFGRELKWNLDELWPLLQSWVPVRSLFGSFNTDREQNRCLILRFHRHISAGAPPIISHWTVGREFQRETLHLFDCTADKNAIHSLPLRECVLSELQMAPDRLLRLEPDSVFFIEKL